MSERYCRQTFLGPTAEALLANTCVAILGLGGGGSHVAQQLAHVGVGGFQLFDDDALEGKNLNRTVGASAADAEAGTLKVKVAERLIRAIQPAARIEVFADKWEHYGTVCRRSDVIIGCVDSFAARDNIERAARRCHIPYIDIGMDVHKTGGGYAVAGQVIASMPDGPCLRCLGFLTEERLAQEAAQYGAAGGRPQVIWPNGVLASTAVGLVIQLVTPWEGSSAPAVYLEYDGNRHCLRPHPRLSYLASDRCSHYSGRHALGEPLRSPKAGAATG